MDVCKTDVRTIIKYLGDAASYTTGNAANGMFAGRTC